MNYIDVPCDKFRCIPSSLSLLVSCVPPWYTTLLQPAFSYVTHNIDHDNGFCFRKVRWTYGGVVQRTLWCSLLRVEFELRWLSVLFHPRLIINLGRHHVINPMFNNERRTDYTKHEHTPESELLLLLLPLPLLLDGWSIPPPLFLVETAGSRAFFKRSQLSRNFYLRKKKKPDS